jgi:hypothetical protein
LVPFALLENDDKAVKSEGGADAGDENRVLPDVPRDGPEADDSLQSENSKLATTARAMIKAEKELSQFLEKEMGSTTRKAKSNVCVLL